MKFVSEVIIDEISESLNQKEGDYENIVTTLQEEQAPLFGYIFSENLSVLTQEEREFLLYLLIVILKSAEKVSGTNQPVPKKELEDAEEFNWAILDNKAPGAFRDRLDTFFENYDQEDLLAFVEDALMDSEDGLVTKEGREVVFVFLKSVIDCL